MRGWRSLLFAAADDTRRLAGIAERGADAVILDLEDAVPADRKPAAREGLRSAIDALAQKDQRVVVRINAGWRDAFADLDVAVRSGLCAVMVPKVEDAARLKAIAELVAEFAVEAGLEEPPALIALIESAAALPHLSDISAISELIGLALGSEDFSLSLGVPPSPAVLDLPCRQIALAAAPRGLMALGLPLSIATISDEIGWSSAVEQARAIGMTGALCIHPRQVGPANRGFAPSEQERLRAGRIVEAWDAAGGSGVILVDGRMVDRPVVLGARRILAMCAQTQ
jgi:citrate lyase subunit beta/citryl-CoA lyase